MKRLLFTVPILCSLISPALADMAAEPYPPAIMAKMASPQPPGHNPHAPQSAEDIRRVNFAVEEIKANYGSNVEIRHPHVIPWSYENFIKNRSAPTSWIAPAAPIQAESQKPMPPMPAPQLKPDEYMVHAYVKFPNDERWHHLDVIISEDESGRLTRRGFFSIPIPYSPSSLPPGVVC